MFFSKFKKKILGFTFLEIIVSVAIVAILASISIIATTRVRIKSRDIKRISNATEIVSALEAYYAANQSYPTMIFPGQPIESNGREYLRAVPSNPSPRTDGGCADSDYTYITTTTGYKLTFCIGSDNSRFAQGVVICKNGNCGIKEDRG
jgi:prepilin-type N-terminal cleavage/methylation domain-containing protein